MAKNLVSNVSETQGNIPCEYIALGCKGAQDSANYQVMCSMHRGAGCGLKVILPLSYLPTGELM